jgi:hypothetical protein
MSYSYTRKKEAQERRTKREECKKRRAEERTVLADIIKNVMQIDVNSPRKTRDDVNAKIIFSKILIDKGHTRMEVGASMDRNHCTATHHYHKFDGYIKFDKELRELYNTIESIFFDDYDPVYDMDVKQLRDAVIDCRDEIQMLENRLREEKQRLIAAQHNNHRFEGIYKTLSRGVPMGMEERVNTKLKAFINGLSGR